MNTHADKTSGTHSRAVANNLPAPQAQGELAPQLEDKRPEAIVQRKTQASADDSPQVRQFKAYQEMADSRPGRGQPAIPYTSINNFASTTIQRQVSEPSPGRFKPVQRQANNTGLPENLKTGAEQLSGFSMDDVKVHYNSSKPAQLQAHAYAQGTDIHIGAGQEKYLPHEAWHVVQQKQGRVPVTAQLKGNTAMNGDPALEAEADKMGEQILQHSVSAYKPPVLKHAPLSQGVVQGAFGMEKESKVPVTSGGNPVPEYPTIGDHAMYKVDIDRSGPASILEVVTKHFNEHEGDLPTALGKINTRLALAWGFVEEAMNSATKPLKPIADKHHVTLGDQYKELVVGNGGTMDGPVHFTVGFSLAAVPAMLAALAKENVKSKGTTVAKKHAAEAATLGGMLHKYKPLKRADTSRINGFIQILYLQVAALLDGAKNPDDGLIKNRILALSRVSMGLMRENLTVPEQKIVTAPEFYIPMINKMQKAYSGIKKAWGDHDKDKELFTPIASAVLKAAFAVDKVEHNDPSAQRGGFGKMTLAKGAEPVGNPEAAVPGFAMEVRQIEVADRTNFASVADAAAKVIKLSRLVHNTPGSAAGGDGKDGKEFKAGAAASSMAEPSPKDFKEGTAATEPASKNTAAAPSNVVAKEDPDATASAVAAALVIDPGPASATDKPKPGETPAAPSAPGGTDKTPVVASAQ